MRTKEVNKVRERFVKDIEVKREVCFTSLAWMPACAGMTHFNGVNPFQFLVLNSHFSVFMKFLSSFYASLCSTQECGEKQKYRLFVFAFLVTIFLGILCALHGYYFYPWYFSLDDAYIVLHSAQVLHLGYDPNYVGSPALLGNTSPLHLLLTSLLIFLFSPLHALWVSQWIAIFLYAWGILALCYCYRLSILRTLIILIIALFAGDTMFQLLNGMETGLMLAGITWAIVLANLPPTKLQRFFFSILLGLFPFIRPELVLLSLIFFVYQFIRYRKLFSWPETLKYGLQDMLIIFLITLPWLIWAWHDTGTILPLTALAKKTFFSVDYSAPFSQAGKFFQALGFFFLHIGFLLIIFIFLLPFSGLGIALFTFTMLLLAGYYFNVPSLLMQNYLRYLYFLPPILLYSAIANISEQTIRGLINSILMITLLQLCFFFPINWKHYSLEVKNLSTVFPDYTAWCNQHIPKGTTLAIQDAGYVAFGTHFPLVDFVGLKTLDSIAYHEKFTYPSQGKLRIKAISEILKKNNIHYLIVTQEWDEGAQIKTGLEALGWKVALLHESKYPYGHNAYLIYYLM